MAAKIITVAQQKGGAGKTTLAAHLAVAYTAMNKKVVAVDIDPQQSLTRWYALRQERLGAAAEGEAGVLVSAIEGWRARVEVDRAAADHDLVIIDSPPHAETEARIAIRAADLVWRKKAQFDEGSGTVDALSGALRRLAGPDAAAVGVVEAVALAVGHVGLDVPQAVAAPVAFDADVAAVHLLARCRLG